MGKGGPAIDVEDLECRYGHHVVLENVSFTVNPGELFFVVGRNGSGKSTLFRHLVGLEQPAAGDVSYFGDSLTHGTRRTRSRLLRSFGVLFQNDALWSSMTLGENVELPLRRHTPLRKRERREIVALKLSQVGLPGQESSYPAELSGGMRKRAALARALALDPSIVLFDEPSAGLDPVTARELEELVVETRDSLGTTMVIISHKLTDIFGMADRLILLDRDARGIVASGKPQALAQEDDREEVRDFLTARLDVAREAAASGRKES